MTDTMILTHSKTLMKSVRESARLIEKREGKRDRKRERERERDANAARSQMNERERKRKRTMEFLA